MGRLVVPYRELPWEREGENAYSANKLALTLGAALVLALAGCGNEEQAQNGTTGANESAQSSSEQTDQEGRHSELTAMEADGPQDVTPLLAEVPYAPIPFAGSDGRTHLVYELEATNFSNGETTIEQLEVLDADTGNVMDTLDTEEAAGRLQPAGLRDTADTADPSMAALVFLHVTFEEAAEVPNRLVHRLSVKAEAAPPDQQQITEEVGQTDIDRRDVVVVGPPLRGSNYIAGESCCDSTLHRRAALPIDGRMRLAQRYAVDWEQLDADSRIYSGEK